MKFALVALVASAAAIQIKGADKCVSDEDSNHVFELIDKNGDGQVSEPELRSAISQWLQEHHIHPTAAQVARFSNAAGNAAGADQRLNPAEFNRLANQVCAYLE